jgi:type IV pilus biogenesis protein CpaD/CtpE
MRLSPYFPVRFAVMLLVFLTVCAASCKRDSSKTTTNPAAASAVKAQLDILRDSVDLKWRSMTASDDQKLGVTRLLLRELKGKPGIDDAQLQSVERANARLKTRRYDQQTMASSDLIDQYDNAQDSLLHVLYPLAAPNGNAPTETARNFVEGIQQLDAGVVPFRLQYNQAARQYNDYLKLHQAEVQSLGGKYAEAKPFPLF